MISRSIAVSGAAPWSRCPTQSQIDRARVLEREMASKDKELDSMLESDLERLNAALAAKGLEPITLPTRGPSPEPLGH